MIMNDLTNIKKSPRFKIVAIVSNPFVNTFDALYTASKLDPDIDWEFVIIPFEQGKTVYSIDNIATIMKEKNYPFRWGVDRISGEWFDLKALDPHVILLQTPYDIQRNNDLYKCSYLSNIAPIVIVSYGATLNSHDSKLIGSLLDNNCYIKAKLVFSENKYMANLINKFHPRLAESVGYLKCFDALNSLTVEKNSSKIITTIAWKPRWFNDQKDSFWVEKFFKNWLQNNSMRKLLFIKHPLLPDAPRWIQKSNQCKIISGFSFLNDVYSADMIIGEPCSTLIEFSLTAKPVIAVGAGIELSEFGKMLYDTWYTANYLCELECLIQELDGGIDPKKNARIIIRHAISDFDPKKIDGAVHGLCMLKNRFYS